MAVKGKSSTKETKSRAVSMNVDDFSTGLADDFDATITKVRAVPWDYNGKIDKPVLGIAVTITPAEDSGFPEFTQTYSAGDISQFAPSQDGEDPVDVDAEDPEEREGTFIVPVGNRDKLSGGSNWAFFLKQAREAGLPADRLQNDLSALEGLEGHWNRIPAPKRSGIVVEGDSGREKQVLVLTAVHGSKKGAGAAKGTGAGAGAKASAGAKADTNGHNDLDEKLTEVITEALAEHDGELAKSKLVGIVMKAFSGAEKAKAVKRAQDVKFLSSRDEAWVFDEDEGTLTAV